MELPFPCDCEGSDLINKDPQHVVTVHLQIIKSNKLKISYTKRSRYKENNNISREKGKSRILEGHNEAHDAINTVLIDLYS